jgi:hypothetical protein
MIRKAKTAKPNKPRHLPLRLVKNGKEVARITLRCGEWTRARDGRCYCNRCEGWPCGTYSSDAIREFEVGKAWFHR